MTKHLCAGTACPGLPYRASECAHPASCAGSNQEEAATAYDREAMEAAVCSGCVEQECELAELAALNAQLTASLDAAEVEHAATLAVLRELHDAQKAIDDWRGGSEVIAELFARQKRAMAQAAQVLGAKPVEQGTVMA